MRKVIMHVDMDAFFASVEQLDNPQLRGKPVIVGADPSSGRGVVSAASYEARKYGVHSAQPITQAYRACPQGNFVRPRFKRYSELSKMVFEIFKSITPIVEPLSIDEAFMDITGTERLHGSPEEIGHRVKDRIHRETGLIASVGIASNMFLAKLASDYDKPDGFVFIEFGKEKEFLSPLSISRVWGVGPKTQNALMALGIETIGDLAEFPLDRLTRRFGKHGKHLWELANGIDRREISMESQRRGISAETTYKDDVSDIEKNIRTLRNIADKLASRMRKKNYSGRTITVKIRYTGFVTITRSQTFQFPISNAKEIFEYAKRIAEPNLKGSIRLLGIRISSLESEVGNQLSLFDKEPDGKIDRLENALDKIEKKFGKGSIKRGMNIDSDHW